MVWKIKIKADYLTSGLGGMLTQPKAGNIAGLHYREFARNLIKRNSAFWCSGLDKQGS